MEPVFDSESDSSAPTGISGEQVFSARVGITRRALLFLIPGIVLVVGGFVLAIVIAMNVPSSPDRKFEPGLNAGFIGLIGPPILGAFLVWRGLFVLRMTRRVVLDVEGVHVHGAWSRRTVAWRDIYSVDVGTREVPNSTVAIPSIELLDDAGRTLAVVTNSVENFGELTQALIARSSGTGGRSTFDEEATEERRVARDAKKIRWAGWVFLIFTLLGVVIFAVGLHEEIHLRRLAEKGVIAEAKVVRTWMVSVTPRIEYQFQDAEGNSFTREAMMYPGREWDKAQMSDTVAVRYLPSDPGWSRLVSGEDTGPELGGKFLYVTAFCILMFAALAVFALLGFDLKTENGVSTLMRHGRVLKSWGPNAGGDSRDGDA